MTLDHDWIASRIPHQYGMCLLDEVIAWTPTGIRCRTDSHRAPDNPLRAHGQLGVACGIEYAAQAMVVHQALLVEDARLTYRSGLLASVRGVTLAVARLDDIAASIVASATYVHGDDAMVLYEFSVADATRVLLSGRATIAFGPEPIGVRSGRAAA
ncbi:MAG: 3-hydroxylacyl-ACP dehydratase [Gammaproteobacteria bacterium]